MTLARWNDDRLDDMHIMVTRSVDRIEHLEKLTESHDKNLTAMHKQGDRRSGHRWDILLIVLGWVPPFAVAIIELINNSHGAH